MKVLTEAKNLRRISMEDLRDAFAVSYETAAHRFTNLATARLGIPVHFMKVHESGTIIKAYENDSVRFPSDALGAVEGTTVCRNWTARTVFDVEDRFSPWYQYTDTSTGTFWCTSRIEKAKEGEYSVSVGRAVRAREVVPRPRDRQPCREPLPGRIVLPTGSDRPRRPLGRPVVACRPHPHEPARGAADGHLPGGRPDRGLRVPRAPRPSDDLTGTDAIPNVFDRATRSRVGRMSGTRRRRLAGSVRLHPAESVIDSAHHRLRAGPARGIRRQPRAQRHQAGLVLARRPGRTRPPPTRS